MTKTLEGEMKGKEIIYENAHKKDNTYKRIRALYKKTVKIKLPSPALRGRTRIR